jgi:hypothetical protein
MRISFYGFAVAALASLDAGSAISGEAYHCA